MAWAEWIADVEVEPSLYAADSRAARRAGRASCCARGCRVFHFDVGDGHFVEPITMGPIVLAVDLAARPRRRRRGRRAPDGRDARQVLRAGRRRRAATASPSTSRRSTTSPRRFAPRASTGCRSGSRSIPRASRRTSPRWRRMPTSCSAWRSIPATRVSRSARRRSTACARLRAALPDGVHIQVDGGVGVDNIAAELHDVRGDAARRRLGDLRARGSCRAPTASSAQRVA